MEEGGEEEKPDLLRDVCNLSNDAKTISSFNYSIINIEIFILSLVKFLCNL